MYATAVMQPMITTERSVLYIDVDHKTAESERWINCSEVMAEADPWFIFGRSY